MNSLVSAILVGLVAVFCMLDSRLLGRLNFEQPLVGATLVGLVLGDPATGLAVGAATELVSMGLVAVGAAVPPDMVLGGIVAAAFACLTDASVETAMTIAIPIAVLGQLLGIVFHPSRLGVILAVLYAAAGYHMAMLVEQQGFRGRCALVNGNDVVHLIKSSVERTMPSASRP